MQKEAENPLGLFESLGLNIVKMAAVAGVEWSSSNLKVGSSIPSLPKKSACRSVLEQDAELRIVPHRTTKVLLIDALYECVCDWVNVKLYCKVL